MNTRTFLFVPLLTCSLLAGCNNSEEDSGKVTQWLGDETHLAVSGTVQGTTFDVLLQGNEASNLYCNRFYTPRLGEMPAEDGTYTDDQLFYAMSEVGGVIDMNGEAKEFTFGYWRHDMPSGTVLDVVPREFGAAIPQGKTWADFNLFNPGDHILSGLESAASSGTVEFLLNDGPIDDGGVMRSDGRLGLFADVSWGPREDLVVSVTADCQSVFVPWASDLVQP